MSFVSTYSSASIRGWATVNNTLWVNLQTLSAPANVAGLQFGQYTAINESGNVIFAAPINPANGRGALAYFGTGINWSLGVQFNMVANYTGIAGNTVAIATTDSGNDVFLGSPGTFNAPAIQGGSVFRFERSGNSYIQTQEISANTPVNSSLFGARVDCSGDANYLAITASNVGNSVGGTFIFNKIGNTYTQQQILTVANNSINGNVALIS